jgi:CheY-like chemotaxis protein
MATVLVADNMHNQLLMLSRYVKQGRHKVITATNPEQATAILNSGGVDVAVLDLKLTDDSPNDQSGIKVAKETNRSIPKIIVSSYETFEAARDALGMNLDSLPAAIDFIKKDKVSTDLLPAIDRALQLKRVWSENAQNRISEQLTQDYKRAQRVAFWHYWTSLVVSIAFAVPIVYGAFQLHGEGSLSILFTVIGVLIAEVTNYLFASKLEFLYERVDRFHAELLQANRFAQLLEAADFVRDEAEREQFKLQVLNSAMTTWITTADAESKTRRLGKDAGAGSRLLAEPRQAALRPANNVGEDPGASTANLRA